MIAVIMAGGKGTRLAGIHVGIPKPLVPIGGRPILYHQLINLKQSGIEEFIFVVGYLKDAIMDYFGDGQKYGVKITYFEEMEPLGTGGALWKLKDRLAGDFVLVYGDIVFDIDWERFIRFHDAKKASISLFSHPNSHPYDSDIIEVDDDNLVSNWVSKNRKPDENYYKNNVNAGLYIVSNDVLQSHFGDGKIDFEKDVILSLIASRSRVYAYPSTEYVRDMGTPDRLESVSADFERGIIGRKNLRNRQKCIFVDRDGTVNVYKGFLSSPTQFELEETAGQAIKKINESGYLCILITNQPVIARGECTLKELERIHAKMETLLGEQGCYLDAVYYCPHHPDIGFSGENRAYKIKCNCRKPEIGMIERAASDYNISFDDSWMIGDSTTDIQTGIHAGIRTILLKTGEAGQDRKYDVVPTYKCGNMLDAVNIVLQGE